MAHVYMRFACIFAYCIGELEIDHLSFAINASALSYIQVLIITKSMRVITVLVQKPFHRCSPPWLECADEYLEWMCCTLDQPIIFTR